jgi:hypothetical protein
MAEIERMRTAPIGVGNDMWDTMRPHPQPFANHGPLWA